MSAYPDHQDLKKSLDTLRSGGLLLYPTDTIWGIGCDPLNVEAIQQIYALKGRDQAKSMILLLENENMLSSYVEEVPDVAYQLIEYSERPLTIVYSKAKNLPPELVNSDGSIGIRIVKHPYCEKLIRRFRRPIVSTSANLSGEPSPKGFEDIAENIRDGVDYIAEYGRMESGSGQPSVVMKLDPSGAFEFLRK